MEEKEAGRNEACESDNLLFLGGLQASVICNHTISLFFCWLAFSNGPFHNGYSEQHEWV